MGVFRIIFPALLLFYACGNAQQERVGQEKRPDTAVIRPGSERTELYLPRLREKNIGVVANQTSLIGNVHLVDSLIGSGIRIIKVFGREHGFLGRAEAGEKVRNTVDKTKDVQIISLYGAHSKPTVADLKGIDIMVFDIQDVGVRFYTYISTLTYVMEACAENDIPLIVLDRPNPNGDYIDGPVLEDDLRSFVGLHPVPVVYGMTIGEYALMINGEKWMKKGITSTLEVIPAEGWDHDTRYNLPVKPSPNLTDMNAIYLYPSLCFFEGTTVSVGRGTETPFRVIGHPDFTPGIYRFTPRNIRGMASEPPHRDKECRGYDLTTTGTARVLQIREICLDWLIEFHSFFKDDTGFFTSYFDQLAGTKTLRKQILEQVPVEKIKAGWIPGIENFKKVRKKYLLYPDAGVN